MSLQQFLKQEAEKQKSPRTLLERSAWVASVDRLVEQIRTWLEEADTEHVLGIKDEPRTLSEEGYGTYEVRGLTVLLGGSTVRVVPVAGRVAGPLRGSGKLAFIKTDGRVDLVGAGMRYCLYRQAEDDGDDRWKIVEEDTVAVRPFDRKTFEHTIERLLK